MAVPAILAQVSTAAVTTMAALGLTAQASAVTAAAATLGRLVAVTGPYGAVVAAAATLAAELRRARRDVDDLDSCRRDAAVWLAEAGIKRARSTLAVAVRVGEIPTAGWSKCWDRGLKTPDRANGRVSYRPPFLGRIREDVLDGSSAAELAPWLAVPIFVGSGDFVVAAPALGPWWLQRSRATTEHTGYPAATLAAATYAAEFWASPPPWARREAARLFLALSPSGPIGARSAAPQREALRSYLLAALE